MKEKEIVIKDKGLEAKEKQLIHKLALSLQELNDLMRKGHCSTKKRLDDNEELIRAAFMLER